MDRRETVSTFRTRLLEVIGRAGLTFTAFARSAGMDRSTLSQLLSPANDRLPRAETLAAIAAAHQVSVDWLLGLSQEGPLGADILDQQLQIEPGTPKTADARLIAWHAEAAGYKIRYVPTTLPDLLKTEEIIRYELRDFAGVSPEQGIESAQARLDYQRQPETDMEACNSVQAIEAFARGEDLWRGLPLGARKRQLRHMIALTEELYPTFRWFLFDALNRYSVPVTVFGPRRAAIYVGQMYFVFTGTEHIRVLTRHFDDLIRAAVVQPPEVPRFLSRLLAELEETAPAG
jgi:transcriptional regulator with XRE-family HTH domain